MSLRSYCDLCDKPIYDKHPYVEVAWVHDEFDFHGECFKAVLDEARQRKGLPILKNVLTSEATVIHVDEGIK